MEIEKKILKIKEIFFDYDNASMSFENDKKALEQIRKVIERRKN